MLRITTLLSFFLILSACWESETDLFSHRLVEKIDDIPVPLLVQYQGKSYTIENAKNPFGRDIPGTYYIDGVGKIKFAETNEYIVVQIESENSDKFSYTLADYWGPGELDDKLNNGDEVQIGFILPRETGSFPKNIETPIELKAHLMAGKNREPHIMPTPVAMVRSMINMDEGEKNRVVQAQKDEFSKLRFERAVTGIFLDRCNKGTLFFSGSGIGGLIGELRSDNISCTIDNGIAMIRLGVDSINNLSCNGEVGGRRQCSLDFNLFCNISTTVADSPTLNRTLCSSLTSQRQPLDIIVLDDGEELEVLEYSLRQ